MEQNISKTGKPINEGFQYQYLSALKIALVYYIELKDFELVIEDKKAGKFDDIVIYLKDEVIAYQVKYSMNQLESYSIDDFTNKKDINDTTKKGVFFGGFAKSWKKIKENNPSKTIKVILLSNISIEREFLTIIDGDGLFKTEFINNKIKVEKKKQIRKELFKSTNLNEEEFQEFLKGFHFKLKQPNLSELENYICDTLLNKNLGIKDKSVFAKLKLLVDEYATKRTDGITRDILNKIFLEAIGDYILPQVFNVHEELYVNREYFSKEFLTLIENTSSGYIILTGPPGSGKSTFLTKFLDNLESDSNYEIIKYYCFVEINDNLQQQRIEAVSLRANFLNQLNNKFYKELDQRFDYSVYQFNETLRKAGEQIKKKNKKLLILVDGLDHAEKLNDSLIKDRIIQSLPKQLPENVILIIGSQILGYWSHLESVYNSDRTKQIPLFTLEETQKYLDKYFKSKQQLEDVQLIYDKSEGLPLYLNYICEQIKNPQNIMPSLNSFPIIKDGDINLYYQSLWQGLHSEGNKYNNLCLCFACLKFPLTKDEINKILKLEYFEFEGIFHIIEHLLKKLGNNGTPNYQIFHNSFKDYILSKTDNGWIKEVNKNIFQFLQNEIKSDLWFRYIFEYAFLSENYTYILENVNKEFVDNALLSMRQDCEIISTIHWAVDAAQKSEDLVSLARLGALKSRTVERLEYNIDKGLIAKTLLNNGKYKEVIQYTFSYKNQSWLVNTIIALDLLTILPDYNLYDKGCILFKLLRDSLKGKKIENSTEFYQYARCLGLYSSDVEKDLNWLLEFEFEANYNEIPQPFSPKYCPHIEAFLESLVKIKKYDAINNLKKLHTDLRNQIIRFYIIKLYSKYNLKELLKNDINEYIKLYHPKNNPEIAFYCSVAGINKKIVHTILGQNILPPLRNEENIFTNDPILNKYRYIYISLGYEQDSRVFNEIKIQLMSVDSWWSIYNRYLLYSGFVIGSHLANNNDDFYDVALEAIRTLQKIKQAPGERIIELIDICRIELQESLYLLTLTISENYPEKIKEWIDEIILLRQSEIWKTHFSIREYIENYEFEFPIFDKIISIESIKTYFDKILDDCETSYMKSGYLKGNDLFKHFCNLSIMASKIGKEKKSQELLNFAINSTWIYGYHKDMTLYQLIQIVEYLRIDNCKNTLSYSLQILEMIDLLPNYTDGKETRYFPIHIFEVINKLNSYFGLIILKVFKTNKPIWVWQHCLEIFILSSEGINPKILWAMTESLINCYSEYEEFNKKVLKLKQSIIYKIKQYNGDLLDEYKIKYDLFVKMNVPIKQWHNAVFDYWELPLDYDFKLENDKDILLKDSSLKDKTYNIKGEIFTYEELIKELNSSFDKYIELSNLLTNQRKGDNDIDYDNDIISNHIRNSQNTSDLLKIKNFIFDSKRYYFQNIYRIISDKFLELRDVENALVCFFEAIKHPNTILIWEDSKLIEDFQKFINLKPVETKKYLIDELCRRIYENYGFDVPILSFLYYHFLKVKDKDEKIFIDYLNYNKSLFNMSSLQQKNNILFESQNVDIEQFAIKIIIDKLDTKEYHLSEKLILNLINLCLNCPDIVLPVIIERINDNQELISERLLSIFYVVAYNKPDLIEKYRNNLVEFLNSNHFLKKLLVYKILELYSNYQQITEKILNENDNIKFDTYISDIYQKKYNIINLEPTYKFIDYYHKNMMKTTMNQIEACCELLGIDVNDMIGNFEIKLKNKGWNEEIGTEQWNNDWSGYVLPEGKKFIHIITTFSREIFKIFNEIIDNILTINKITKTKLDGLWRILQPIDPEFLINLIIPKPNVIPNLKISNQQDWLVENENLDNKIIRADLNEEWITLYETRVIKEEEHYYIPNKNLLFINSYLIDKNTQMEIPYLSELFNTILKFEVNISNETSTLEQFKSDILQKRFVYKHNNSFYPILIIIKNPITFIGPEILASIPEYLIIKYDLKYRYGLNMLNKNKCVIKYENWQEGYEDDIYSRDRLAFGIRLMIKNEFLSRILQDYNVKLCSMIEETRIIKKEAFRGEIEKKQIKYFKIYS